MQTLSRPGFCLFLAAWLVALPSRAQDNAPAVPPAMAMTLNEAVSLALRENYDIRSAYLQRLRDKFAWRVAHDKFQPHYSTSVSVGHVWEHGPATVQSVGGDVASLTPHLQLVLPTGTTLAAELQYSVTQPATFAPGPLAAGLVLSASQPLLHGFGYDVNMASVVIGDLRENSNLLALKSQLIASISNVIFAYRDLTRAKLFYDIAENALKRSRELLEINHQMVAAGRMAPADLIQTESEIATREVNLVNAEGDYVGFQVTILELLALRDGMTIVPVPEAIDTHPMPPLEDAHRRALGNRPEYLTGLINRDIALKNLVVAQNNCMWDLNVTAEHRRGSATSRFGGSVANLAIGPSNSTAVALVLSVPLLDLQLQQGVVNSEVALRQAEVQISQVRNNVTLEVDGAMRGLALRQRRFELAKRARQLAEKKLNNEREKLGAGRSSNFQVLRFVDDLVNAEVAEIQANTTYLNAVTQLQMTMGSLLDAWEIDFR